MERMEHNIDGVGQFICRMRIPQCNSGLNQIPHRIPMVGLVLIISWGLVSPTFLRL